MIIEYYIKIIIRDFHYEYYNLALAGAFKTDDGFYYLSFPSAEVNKIKEGDFILSGKNFGCGSSREHAPIALSHSGVKAILALSFA